VLASVKGESSPNNLNGGDEFLLATNAGSNSITLFRVTKNGLEQIDVEPSNGEKPVSVTVNRGIVYVAEQRRNRRRTCSPQLRRVAGRGSPIGNRIPSVEGGPAYADTQFAAGYTVNADGTLTATSGSVGNGGTDTCWFVVTDNGKIGFTTSFFGGGRISSYRVGSNGSLELIDGAAADATVTDGASDLALSRNSRYLYQLNSLDGTISSFRVEKDADLVLTQIVTPFGPNPMGAPLGLAAR